MVSMKYKNTLAISFLILDSLFYVILSIISRYLNTGFENFTQVYLRLSIAFILSIIVFKKRISLKRILEIPLKDKIILLIMGIWGYGVAVYFLTLGALNTNIVNVSFIAASAPLFTYLFSVIFLSYKINLRLILLVLFSILGIGMIATKSFFPLISNFGKGELFTVLGAIGLSSFFVGRKKLSEHLNNGEITTILAFLAAASTFAFSMISHESLPSLDNLNGFLLLAVLVGGILNVTSTFLETFSFGTINTVLGNQILLFESVFAMIFGYLIYQEIPILPEIVGGLVVIISVFLSNMIVDEVER